MARPLQEILDELREALAEDALVLSSQQALADWSAAPASTSRPTKGSNQLPASRRLHEITVSGQTRRT